VFQSFTTTPLPSPTVKKFNVTGFSDYTSNSFHTYKIRTNGTKEGKPLPPKGSSPFHCVPFTCSVPIKNIKKLFHGLFHGKKACNKVLQDMTNVASFLGSHRLFHFHARTRWNNFCLIFKQVA
jgi:hypothetical protein